MATTKERKERNDVGGKHESSTTNRRLGFCKELCGNGGNFTRMEFFNTIMEREKLATDRSGVIHVYTKRFLKKHVDNGNIAMHGGGQGDRETFYTCA
jgi:hypothetical protein